MVKVCCNCGVEKAFSKFNVDNNHSDGLSSRCKECIREYQRKWYKENKATRIPQIKKIRERNKNYIRDIKKNSECLMCGEKHPATLDFHHRNPKEKEFVIAEIHRRGWSIEKIAKEISKCDILCANCHRKLHYEQRNMPSKLIR